MRMRIGNRKGFTLVEILVVLSLTMIVMGLVLVPLAQSLKITRTAEIMIRAQDGARFAIAQVTEDLSDAMYVFDNTQDFMYFPVTNSAGRPVMAAVYYTKVDLVLPKMRGYCPVNASHTGGGIYRGDEAAPTCPVCGAELELKPIEPLTQDDRIVRYFIGLRDPTRPYDNGYEKRRSHVLTEYGTDNMFILYRVEFDPSDENLFPLADSQGPRTPERNRMDENFFYNTEQNGRGETYAEAWRKISRPVAAVEDVDLISLKFDHNGDPVISPTVRFAPTAVYNDPLTPVSQGSGDSAPTTYKASYGNWVLPYKVILQPASSLLVTYETMPGMALVSASEDSPADMCVYKVDRTRQGQPVYTFVFNITHYDRSKFDNIYGVGEMLPSMASNRERVFTVDTARGTVNAAFPNVYKAHCNDLNNTVQMQFNKKNVWMSLSDVASTDFVAANGTLLINYMASGATRDPRVLPGANVVPGTVRIFAPDGTLGPGSQWVRDKAHPLVAYASAPSLTAEPGANQFSVDVGYGRDELGNPAQGVAAVHFSRPKTISGSGAVLPKSHQDTAGGSYQGLNNILVYYEVQNNQKSDILRASYVTKSIMTVQLGMRIYDVGTGRAQTAQLANKVRLRNVAQ